MMFPEVRIYVINKQVVLSDVNYQNAGNPGRARVRVGLGYGGDESKVDASLSITLPGGQDSLQKRCQHINHALIPGDFLPRFQ